MKVLALIAVVAAALMPAAPANASATYPAEQWRFRTSDVCVETHGWRWWPTVEAARRWDAAPDVHVYAWWDCASRPRNQVVVFRVDNDPINAWCGKTGSDAYDWVYSGGQWTWAPRAMVIWLNVASRWASGCTATAAMRAHVISHELGHALGMAHRTGASVMASWSYQWPTTIDLAGVEDRYPW